MTNVRIDKERMEAVTSSRPMTRFKHFMSGKGEYRMFEQRNNELIVETWSDKVPVCTCYR